MADDITKEIITEKEIQGAGTFDHLMDAVDRRLLEQFSQDRIRHTDYANVYVGSLNTTMQQAIQLELGRQVAENQADLIEAQKRLVESQIIGQDRNNDLIACQIEKCEAETALLVKELEIKDAQIINWGFQNQLVQKQIEKITEDILLTQQQVLTAAAQRAQIEANTTLTLKQVEKVTQDILVAEQQVLQSIQQVELIKQQVINLGAEFDKIVAETGLTTQRTINAQEENNVLKQQVLKLAQEVQLLIARVRTELAQTNDQLEGEDVGGIVGRKITLFQRQADAFLRDAEQKAAKIYADIWNISKSADPTGVFETEILGEMEYQARTEEVIDDNGNTTIQEVTDPDTGNVIYDLKLADPSVGGYTKLLDILETLRTRAKDPTAE